MFGVREIENIALALRAFRVGLSIITGYVQRADFALTSAAQELIR